MVEQALHLSAKGKQAAEHVLSSRGLSGPWLSYEPGVTAWDLVGVVGRRPWTTGQDILVHLYKKGPGRIIVLSDTSTFKSVVHTLMLDSPQILGRRSYAELAMCLDRIHLEGCLETRLDDWFEWEADLHNALHALASPPRRRIYSHLLKYELSAKDLSTIMRCDRSTITKHIKVLSNGNYLLSKKVGRKLTYHINPWGVYYLGWLLSSWTDSKERP